MHVPRSRAGRLAISSPQSAYGAATRKWPGSPLHAAPPCPPCHGACYPRRAPQADVGGDPAAPRRVRHRRAAHHAQHGGGGPAGRPHRHHGARQVRGIASCSWLKAARCRWCGRRLGQLRLQLACGVAGEQQRDAAAGSSPVQLDVQPARGASPPLSCCAALGAAATRCARGARSKAATRLHIQVVASRPRSTFPAVPLCCRLAALGTSLELKSRFGVGYTLTLSRRSPAAPAGPNGPPSAASSTAAGSGDDGSGAGAAEGAAAPAPNTVGAGEVAAAWGEGSPALAGILALVREHVEEAQLLIASGGSAARVGCVTLAEEARVQPWVSSACRPALPGAHPTCRLGCPCA